MDSRQLVLQSLADCRKTKRGQTIMLPQKSGDMILVMIEMIPASMVEIMLSDAAQRTRKTT